MKQSIYIECYEGLSARMLTEALLDLMPEGKAARKLGAQIPLLKTMRKKLPQDTSAVSELKTSMT